MAASIRQTAGDQGLAAHPRRVAVVGSRDATPAGIRRAQRLARELAARDVVVVSGLARGIDAAAHRAAMAAGGRTIAVIGTPLDRCYPREHAPLQAQIAAEHLLISPFAEPSPVRRSNFAQRNQVIAELSHAAVVVEAQDNSGSLYVPREMLRLGRPTFFCASALANASIAWPRNLQRCGAVALRDTEQIIHVL